MKFGRKSAGRIDPEELGSVLREGLTQSKEEEEAAGHASAPSGDEVVQQHLGGVQKTLGRLPVFRALLKDDTESVWVDGQTDRLQRNVKVQMEKSTFDALQEGHMCLRCFEPQPNAFPKECDLCGYPMQSRQIIDIAVEFKGREHVGPAKGFNEFLAEQEERMQKAAFEKKIKDGGSKGRRRG